MKLNNKKGFTLAEMIIVITLLGLLISLAYMTFDHLTQTYYRTERKWLIESDISHTMRQLSNATDASLALMLSNDVTELLKTDDATVLYYDKNYTTPEGEVVPSVMVREPIGDDGVEKTPFPLNEFPVEISFSNIKKTDNGDGTFTEEKRDNVIFITLTSLDDEIDYTLETAVYMQNLDKIKTADDYTEEKDLNQNPVPFTGTAVLFVASDGSNIDLGIKNMSGGCFIATAAYGDYDDNMVMLLRRFRDQCLLTNPVGEKFVEFYYNVSPPIADFIRDSNLLKNIVKILLLPLVGIALFLLHPAPISAIIMLLIGLVILIKILLKKRKKLADI